MFGKLLIKGKVMGIDIDGGMIIGREADDITLPDDYEGSLSEWCKDNNLDIMSKWYDAGQEGWIIGFEVPVVFIDDIEEAWLPDVKKLAKRFEELTGEKPLLIGTQNVW